MLMNIGLFLQMRNLQREVLGALLPLKGSSRTQETLPKRFPAPGFETIDTEGNLVSLAGYHDTNVLLIFASPTCNACQAIYPTLKEFSDDHPEVEIILLSNGDDDQNKGLVLDYGYEFPVALLTKELSDSYLISTVPFAYLIDDNGLIVSGSIFSKYSQLGELLDSK